MSRKYFGTDGVRGKANSGAMTADTGFENRHGCRKPLLAAATTGTAW